MTVKTTLASLGLLRRLPYLSDLYYRIDAAHAETAAARAEVQAARAESDAAQAETSAARAESQVARAESTAANAKLTAIEDMFANERFVLQKHMGSTLLLDRTSFVDKRIIDNHGWETEQLNRLFSYCDVFEAVPGKRYFIDCGAYWGLYSLTAYKKHWFDHIIAFEPEPLNRAQLNAQLALNLLPYEVDVRGVALSDERGSESFWKSTSHPTGNRAGVGMYPSDGSGSTILVPTDTLDNQLEITSSVLFIKVDVEGLEVKLLLGGKRLFTENQVVLQIESMMANNPEVVRSFLGKRGYKELGNIADDLYFSNGPID